MKAGRSIAHVGGLLVLASQFMAWTDSRCMDVSGRFFRLVSTNDSRAHLTLTRSGRLWIESSSALGVYRVEWSENVEAGPWWPFLRAEELGRTGSVRVFVAPAPEGFALVPGGRFRMGDLLNDHREIQDVHDVELSPFLMSRFETTNEEYCEIMNWAYTSGLVLVQSNNIVGVDGRVYMALGRYDSEIAYEGGRFVVREGREHHPVAYVSWYGAAAYCNYRSIKDGLEPCYDVGTWTVDPSRNGYRLPTESEWECAARGGLEARRFPWADSDVITHAYANYRSNTNVWYDQSPTRGFHPVYGNSRPRSSPVGSFAANHYGLYDMIGNIYEWVHDWAARYERVFQRDPLGPATGTFKVLRGGSWYTTAERATCAARYVSARPEEAIGDVGFRVVVRVPSY